MAGGWIKLHRCLLDKAIWLDSTPEQKTILITLLLMANHEGKEWEWHGKQFKASPGQFITSANSIIEKAGKGISRQNVRSALTKFKKYEFLTYESTKTGILVTIVNWGNYQGYLNEGNQDTNQEVTNSQPRGNQQVTTNKNDKKDKNYKEGKNIRSIFVPPTFEEVKAYCQERNSGVDPKKFYDYFNEGGWKDSQGKPVRNWKQKLITWEKHTDKPKHPGNYTNQRQYDMAELEKQLLGRG